MSSKSTPALVLGALLIIGVMAASIVITLKNPAPSGLDSDTLWEHAYSGVKSMKIIDLTGDGEKDLFLQNDDNVTVLNSKKEVVFSNNFPFGLATSMGDVNGDGKEDIVCFAGEDVSVFSQGEKLWNTALQSVSNPTRVAVLRFASGTQVVAGDSRAQLIGLSASGEELWRAGLGSPDDEGIRGLDDALVNGKVYLAAANHDGAIGLYDEQGKQQRPYRYDGSLRRLRSYDLDGDGNSEVLLGGDSGSLVILQAADFVEKWSHSQGQAITEIREAELDGNPAEREFVAGGKKGGIWAYRMNGTLMWSATMGDKITEIAAIDLDEDGSEEVVIGNDAGNTNLFAGKNGERISLGDYSGGIQRIDAGKLGGTEQVVIANNASVNALTLSPRKGSILFTPLIAGLLISLGIAAATWFVATMPPKPAMEVSIQNQTPEGLMTRRKMLHESIADVDRLRAAGDMEPEAYLSRVKELRKQLAETEASIRQSGAKISPQAMKCPNCGGTLILGHDKCDYCGQVVIT